MALNTLAAEFSIINKKYNIKEKMNNNENNSETNNSETNNSENNSKTNNTVVQNPVSFFQITQAIARLMGEYMLDDDLDQFSKLDLSFLPSAACQQDLDRRKFVKEKILPTIFNAVPHALKSILKHKDFTLNMLLTKSSFNEGYLSNRLGEFVLFRLWGGVSPLTAAAYSGDEFFVLRILAYLVQDDNLRTQARQQLEEVQKRITDQTFLLDAATAIVNLEFGKDDLIKKEARQRLEKIQQSKEFLDLIADQSVLEEAMVANVDPSNQASSTSTSSSVHHKNVDQKIMVERNTNVHNKNLDHKTIVERNTNAHNKNSDPKVIAERKLNAEKYEEDKEFLTPFLRLVKSTLNYLIHYPKFITNFSRNLDDFWKITAECHKRICHNLKQEWFDPKKIFSAHAPVDFDREPNRGPCYYVNGSFFNLDDIGMSTLIGLYKLNDGSVAIDGAWRRGMGQLATENLGAILPYFKRRTTGLGTIIEKLKNPETAGELVAPYINKSQPAKKVLTHARGRSL